MFLYWECIPFGDACQGYFNLEKAYSFLCVGVSCNTRNDFCFDNSFRIVYNQLKERTENGHNYSIKRQK